MSVPADLRYTPEHEWVSIDGTTASIGITEYAAQQLGDVVYISLPPAGTSVSAGEPCGEVESVKSVSDLYSPVDGEVVEVNGELPNKPETVNQDPYGKGWMIVVKPSSKADWDQLLTAQQYEELLKQGGH